MKGKNKHDGKKRHEHHRFHLSEGSHGNWTYFYFTLDVTGFLICRYTVYMHWYSLLCQSRKICSKLMMSEKAQFTITNALRSHLHLHGCLSVLKLIVVKSNNLPKNSWVLRYEKSSRSIFLHNNFFLSRKGALFCTWSTHIQAASSWSVCNRDSESKHFLWSQ